MLRFRQGWLGIIGDVVTFGPLLWRFGIKPILGLLSLGGDVDFFLEHSRHAGWVGDVIDIIGHPLAQVLIIIAGIGLIYLDQKHRASETKPVPRKMEPRRMIALGLAIIIVGVVVISAGVWRGKELAGAPLAAQASTHVSVEPLKIPAPYYNKTDVDKVLEATREISDLLQIAILVRDSSQHLTGLGMK